MSGPVSDQHILRLQQCDRNSSRQRGSKAHRRSGPHTARTDRAWVRRELRGLPARIVALRRECNVKVERARRKSEGKWAIERGEVVVVVKDGGDGEEGNLVDSDAESGREDADGGEMVVDKHNAQTVTTSLTTNNDDDKQQWQWSFRSSPFAKHRSHRSESNFLPPRPPPLRKTQQQQHLSQRQRQQEDNERGPAGEIHTVSHAGRRLLRKNHPSQGRTSSRSRPRPHHPQPLQRQSTQLMMIPTSSHSHDLNTYGTYGTAVLDPETEIRFGGINGDKEDSELDG
jgi:hypothetical protein